MFFEKRSNLRDADFKDVIDLFTRSGDFAIALQSAGETLSKKSCASLRLLAHSVKEDVGAQLKGASSSLKACTRRSLYRAPRCAFAHA